MKDYKGLKNGTDIRGIALKTENGPEVSLTKTATEDITRAFAVWLASHYGKNELVIAVGRDSRVTGNAIMQAVFNTLEDIGVTVYNLGMATTPAMFMSTQLGKPFADGAIMITASHLPMDRNGLKFFTKEGGLESSDISYIITLAEAMQDDLEFSSKKGKIYAMDFMSDYAAHLRRVICSGLGEEESTKPLTGLKIIVDAGNGAGGFYVSKVLEPLGADCSGSQFLEPDGSFPNHVPNPENKEAMESICSAVKANSADLGLIFDTDVDRAAAVGSDGKEIARNRIVALAAVIASKGHPGTTIVTDSITSTQLAEFLSGIGCKHYRFKRGYKNVIDKGLELNEAGVDCRLAIETSGHAAMADNYFLDDGAYLAAKIVVEAALLKKSGKHIEDMISEMTDPLEAREIRFKVLADDFAGYAQSVLDCIEDAVNSGNIEGWSPELPNYEGVRVNVPGGWFLIRKSLHDPVIPLNIESDIPGGAEKTLEKIKEIIKDFSELE